MFKGQPKGLYALALANTGERFGYYTMMAIFSLFLQAKFNFSPGATANIYSIFMACVYFLPIIGGMLADRFGYGRMVTTGIFTMFAGYTCLAVPTGADTTGMAMMFAALFLIALGTGLFKGNLQVLVGNLYDDPRYSGKRDTAFSLFYMAINIGSLFAPTAASKITAYFMKADGFRYRGDIPALCHEYLDKGTGMAAENLRTLSDFASAQTASATDLAQFADAYLATLSQSYHYGFAVACFSLVLSYLIYVCFRGTFRHVDVGAKHSDDAAPAQELTPEQTRSRMVSLFLVFAVVIFFWMAFQQNGLTLTWFARDFTVGHATGITGMGFNVINLVSVIIAVYAAFAAFQSESGKGKAAAGAVFLLAAGYIAYAYTTTASAEVEVLPQMFQQFNPFFVVALTPVSLAVFGALARRGKEPSAPRKIGIGMVIAALGFGVMALCSFGLPTPNADGATVVSGDMLMSPWVLINTYLVLTFAELFLSPMGISFVSKVAPPKYKGLMMGCWFGATAIGNYLVSVIGMLWGRMPMWSMWSVLVALCLLSAMFIFAMMKKLESATR